MNVGGILPLNVDKKLGDLTPDRIGALDAANVQKDVQQIKKLSEEFESMFLDIVLKSMRDASPKSELMGESNGEQIFKSMLDSEYSKEMASQRLTGLAQNLEAHLLQLMQQQQKTIEQVKGAAVYGLTGGE